MFIDENDIEHDFVHQDKDLHAYVSGRLDEAQVERGLHQGQWGVNYALYRGYPVKRTGPSSGISVEIGQKKRTRDRYSAPITQGAVIATTAIQTETPPRWSYVGRETNEPPEVYFRPSGAVKAQEAGAQFDPGQLAGKAPITEEAFNQLMAQTRVQDTGEVQSLGDGGEAVEAPITNNIPIFSEDDFVLVTDQLAAEALTQESASEFDMISGDEFIRINILRTNVIGHDDSMVQWMPQKRRFGLTGLYPYNVWVDPQANSITDAEFVVIRQELSLNAARKEYPEHADILVELSNSGAGLATMTPDESLGGRSQRNTVRKFVERITMWERNTPYPMSVNEAMELGLVQPDMVEVLAGFDEQGQQITEMRQSEDGEGRPLFSIEGQEDVIAEGDEGWPDRYGIRQIELLADFVVLDQETEFSEIPISRNRNIPDLFSPYAMGEPERLQDLQYLHDTLMTIFINHFDQYKHPQLVVPASVLKEMGMSVEEAFRKHIKMWALPDKLLDQFGGDIIKVLNVPQLNVAAMSMFNIVREEMDRVSGMNDTLRGDTKSDQSARLFSEATAAARGPIGYKAQHTNDYLKRIGDIVGNLIIDFLPTAEWVKRNKKYPAPIIESMRSRLKRIGFDVVPIIGASSGRQQKVDRLSSVIQQGTVTPTLVEELLDGLEVDKAPEIADEVRQQMQAQPTA